MPTRARKPADHPEPERSGDEEEPIEILEVVGVDETTGAVKEESRRRGPERPDEKSGRASVPSEVGASAGRLEEALAEKEKYYDLFLRKQAEFDNYRKRMDRERLEFGGSAARDVLLRLLPVLDNMERALRASEGSADPLFKGIGLVHQQFLDLLKKEGVVPIESLGARFDPRLHEAVDVVALPGSEPDVILEEMQKGYTCHDRLLRPALVRVAAGRGTGTGAGGPQESDGESAGEEP